MTKKITYAPVPRPGAAGGGGRALLTLCLAAAFALAGALPADAQASRTRPSGGTSSGTASGGSRSTPSSPAPSTPRTAVSPAPSPAPSSGDSAPSSVGRTRPGSATDDGRTVIERDARQRRPHGDVVIVNPWAWWNSYFWRYGYGGYYGPYGGYYGDYYGPYGHYGPAWAGRRANERMGALDLDLKPGDTQVYLDGQLIGEADRFDGWPGYLWLDEGDYHFVFYREGYRTIAREYRVRPGLVIDVEDRLDRGESVPPEELVPPRPTPRRDARILRNEELRRRAGAAPVTRPEADDATDDADDALLAGEEGSDWRERAPAGALADDDGVGTLRLVVVPADASVYLDGRFLGTGAEVGRLRRGLAIAAGEHLLEVVRPGHAPMSRQVVVEDGADLELEITLEPR